MATGEVREFDLEAEIARSKALRPGSEQYRAYVGPPAQYDFMGATQFRLLTGLGLREEHRVLDLGCGSLRAGKFLIQYLLPDRYIGVEPNAWLWRTALEREIGQDVVAIKRPRFTGGENFRLGGIDDGSIDVAVAQSIYSHAGSDAVALSLAEVARVLAGDGQFLFTALTETTPSYDRIARGRTVNGWVYPPCVGYPEAEILALCSAAGLEAQRLRWYHPRQTWFRAILPGGPTLSPEMERELGTGRPLYDPRFR